MRLPGPNEPGLTLSQLFERWPGTAGVFLAHRTLCWGCPIARFHTVAEAVREHRLDEAEFRAGLRAAADGRAPR